MSGGRMILPYTAWMHERRHRTMGDWYANPVVWTLVVLAIVAGAGRFWYWRGQVDNDRDAFKKFMTDIGRKIDKIQENVHELLGVVRSVSKPGSPLKLTELGNKVAECLESRGIFQDIEPLLSDRIHGKQPYEIHDICFEYISGELNPSPEMDAVIRLCAYENGVKREDVLEVMAIELRDRLLSKQEK